MAKPSSAPIEVVCALVLDPAGRFFAARRAPGQAWAGHWEFPGGKLEPGETAQAGLRREWQEEFALELQVGAMLHELSWTRGEQVFRLRAFWARLGKKEMQPSVHDQWGFYTVQELLSRELLPADVVILAKAEAALQEGSAPLAQE